jgi:hypothetical protein
MILSAATAVGCLLGVVEEDVLNCHRTGRNWRLAMGERIFKHREVVKKRGTRNWTNG